MVLSGNKVNKKQLFVSLLSAVLVSVASTLIMILLFALLIRFFNINDIWIFPVNQIIKAISIMFGVIIMLKQNHSQGFYKGIILGITYFLLSTVVFSILQGSFSFKLNNLYDMLLTTLIGGIIGIIVVNIRKNHN